MVDLDAYCGTLSRNAKAASRLLATAGGARKNDWLIRSAEALISRAEEVLQANDRDVSAAGANGLSSAEVDRLRLNRDRLRAAAAGAS